MSRRGPKLNFSDDSSGDETEFGMENMNTEERKHLFTEGSRKCRPLTRNEKFCLVGGLIAVVVVVLLFVLIGVFSLSRGSSAAEPWKNVRLPESLRPLNYVLNLQVLQLIASYVHACMHAMQTVATRAGWCAGSVI